MVSEGYNRYNLEDYTTLRSVAEDLKTPLLRIISQLQIDRLSSTEGISNIEVIADAAIRLMDSYVVSTQMGANQQQLKLEPLSVHAVMDSCNRHLKKLALIHGYETEFKIQKRVGLVMANPTILNAAMTSLAYSFIYNTESQKKTNQKLIFMIRRTKKGVDAGMFSSGFHVSTTSWQKIDSLAGATRQLMPDFAHGSSAGIVIANKLFNIMGVELRPTRYKRLSGLIVNMLPSKQLSLV